MLEIFKVLSENSRLRILSLILSGEMCVCEIESILKLTQSNASRHLIELRRVGILENYKKAQWTYYKLNDNFIQGNKELWEYLQKKLKQIPTYEKDYKELELCRSKNICNFKNAH